MSTSVTIMKRLFGSFDPRLSDVTVKTISLTVKQRSMVIKCCQAQYVPRISEASVLLELVKPLDLFIHPKNSYNGRVYSILALLQGIKDLVESPLSSSVVLDIMRSVPLENDEVIQSRLDGWGKEIAVLESSPKEIRFNFRAVFNPQFFQESLVPDLIPPKPWLNRYLHKLFSDWLSTESNLVHYPRSTFKTMSRSTIREYENYTGEKWLDTNRAIWSQRDYERLYLNTGIQLSGICEMRQRWYRSQAKPSESYTPFTWRSYRARKGHTLPRVGLPTRTPSTCKIVSHDSTTHSLLHIEFFE